MASNEYDTGEKEITKSATVEYYEDSEIPKKPTINEDFYNYGNTFEPEITRVTTKGLNICDFLTTKLNFLNLKPTMKTKKLKQV